MQSRSLRKTLFNLICSSCFGSLNFKSQQPEKNAGTKVLRAALRSSVGRLLDRPRFSSEHIGANDLTWKGTNHQADESVPDGSIDAFDNSDQADLLATDTYSHDWSVVGYDPKYRTIRRLSEQEELRFIALAKVGDRFARQKLIIHHLPLLKGIAQRHANRGLALSELVNEGTFGLVRAIERFDPSRELRFGTYAKWWIRDAMEQALLKQSRLVRLPGHVVRSMREQQRAESRNITASAAAEDSTPAEEHSLLALETSGTDATEPIQALWECSIDTAGWDELSETQADSADDTTPEMVLNNKQMHESLLQALSQISERESTVLVRRFGLYNDEPETLEDVATALGISCERVRQIQKAALKKLKSYLEQNSGGVT